MDSAIVESKAKDGRQAEIEAQHQQKVLDTPRTRDACKKLGLVLEDLQYRARDSFYIPGDKKELIQLRYDHAEDKRKKMLAQVLAERAKVIAANAHKGEVPGVQSGQFLSMLESLFEKEAKRLETDLKAQLRQHSSLVRVNEEQLKKEERLRDQRELHAQKIKEVSDKKLEYGREVKDKLETRLAKNAKKNEELAAEHSEKQVAHARALIAEEERMERFRAEQGLVSAEKSAAWKAKVDRMHENARKMQEDKKLEGQAKLLELEAKIKAVSERREEEQNNRVIKSEKQHLHLMDVRGQKDRIDRMANHTKMELRDQIEGNVERIETLLALKDQLLDQRKARTLKAEATRGSRGLNLARDIMPGPGQYEAPKSCMFENPCGRISQSKTGHSEFIDAVTRKTAFVPPPGSYDNNLLKNGDKVDQAGPGVKFSGNVRKSFLDDATASKADVPAPGIYETKSSLDEKGTRIRRAKVQDPNIDKKDKRNYPIWARSGTETPGPAGYSVDDYTRKETLRRAQRSLPGLTRDMLRPS